MQISMLSQGLQIYIVKWVCVQVSVLKSSSSSLRHATIKSSMRRSRNEHISPNPSGKAGEWLTNRPANQSVQDTRWEEPIMFHAWITWPWRMIPLESELSRSVQFMCKSVFGFAFIIHLFFTFFVSSSLRKPLLWRFNCCHSIMLKIVMCSFIKEPMLCWLRMNDIQEQHIMITSPSKNTLVDDVWSSEVYCKTSEIMVIYLCLWSKLLHSFSWFYYIIQCKQQTVLDLNHESVHINQKKMCTLLINVQEKNTKCRLANF